MQPEAKAWTTYLYKLIDSAPTLDSHIACEKALGFLEVNYPDFFTHPASSKPNQHHHTVCGLAQHTAEVIQIGLQTRAVLNLQDEVSFDEYFIAALYHDTGKVLAYGKKTDGTWEKTVLSRKFHHIWLGARIFEQMMVKEKLNYPEEGGEILHAILAHHGCREWGSPVAPATPLAQLLYQSDTMSARMNDIVRGVTPLEYSKYKAGEQS